MRDSRNLSYSRALVVLSAEELGQLSEVVALAALLVAALLIAAPHARLVVLYNQVQNMGSMRKIGTQPDAYDVKVSNGSSMHNFHTKRGE